MHLGLIIKNIALPKLLTFSVLLIDALKLRWFCGLADDGVKVFLG